MADPGGRQLRKGDGLGKLSAKTWNALVDSLGEKRQGYRPGLPIGADSETRVLVRNDTDDDVQAFGVVKIGVVLVEPTLNESEFLFRRSFEGELPAADSTFAITQEAIPSGEFGWALVLGVTTCTLNVASASDTHAGPADGDTADLATAMSGPARILWKEDGTGAGKKAKVLLSGGSAAGGSAVLEIQSGGTDAYGYPAFVQTWDAAAGSWSDIPYTVRVEDPNGNGWDTGDFVVAMFVGMSDSGVACYAAVPPGGGAGAPTITDFHLAANAGPATSTSATMGTVAATGYYQLVLNPFVLVSAVGAVYYGIRELSYGGGPALGSVTFIGPGQDNASSPRRTYWVNIIPSNSLNESWTSTTFAQITQPNVRFEIWAQWGPIPGPSTVTILGGASDYYTSLTAHRLGDL